MPKKVQLTSEEAKFASAQTDKKLSDEQVSNLIDKALEARQRAHCPYSKFSVGAALLEEGGRVILGCNVENISYGLTICAERTAISSAVIEGLSKFQAIAIVADMGQQVVGPCGACRQVLAEFCPPDLEIFLSRPSGEYVKTSLGALLPDSFTPGWVTLPGVAQ